MPLIENSSYTSRPFYLPSGHLETIYPSLFFKLATPVYARERLELNDGDFLDIDWVRNNSSKCMIISHGLEGGSDRYYVRRTATYFSNLGWDICAWNCRSCSGEMNRLPRFYHHGDTPDLHEVVSLVFNQGYKELILFGYSMGGSMSLKYLGEKDRDKRIKGAITFSVPCNLRDSALEIHKRTNRFYEKRFLTKVVEKMKIKARIGYDVEISGIDDLKEFDEFHERYTVPLHGFSSLSDFYEKSTCDQYLARIEVPVLVANALNDPMLGNLCYPRDIAQSSDHVHLETPAKGGHVGFTFKGKYPSWMEIRAEQFLATVIN